MAAATAPVFGDDLAGFGDVAVDETDVGESVWKSPVRRDGTPTDRSSSLTGGGRESALTTEAERDRGITIPGVLEGGEGVRGDGRGWEGVRALASTTIPNPNPVILLKF